MGCLHPARNEPLRSWRGGIGSQTFVADHINRPARVGAKERAVVIELLGEDQVRPPDPGKGAGPRVPNSNRPVARAGLQAALNRLGEGGNLLFNAIVHPVVTAIKTEPADQRAGTVAPRSPPQKAGRPRCVAAWRPTMCRAFFREDVKASRNQQGEGEQGVDVVARPESVQTTVIVTHKCDGKDREEAKQQPVEAIGAPSQERHQRKGERQREKQPEGPQPGPAPTKGEGGEKSQVTIHPECTNVVGA